MNDQYLLRIMENRSSKQERQNGENDMTVMIWHRGRGPRTLEFIYSTVSV